MSLLTALTAPLWLSLLVPSAEASGIMFPPVHRLLGAGCAAAPRAAMSPHQRLRYTGYRSGATSPPGGPVMHHQWPISSRQVTLRRVDCDAPTPGRWVETGERCDGAPVLEWSGPVEAGATYRVSVEGWAVVTVEVAGEGPLLACAEQVYGGVEL